MVFHSSVKSCKNVGTREMGSRVRCNEFGDETNQRLVEPGMSAKRVDTSMRLVGMTSVWLHDRSRCKPGASYQCGKSWFVNVMTDWKSSSSRIHRGKKRCPGMNSSIQMRVAMCLMNVRRKSRNFDQTTMEWCSSVDLSAEDTQE